MLTVETSDIEIRLGTLPVGTDTNRLQLWVNDSIELIYEEFSRRGRDFDEEMESTPWLAATARRVVREMVMAVVRTGDDVGRRSVSIRAGQVSEAYTFDDTNSVSWGGVTLTADQLERLGLAPRGLPRWGFPKHMPWPERVD